MQKNCWVWQDQVEEAEPAAAGAVAAAGNRCRLLQFGGRRRRLQRGGGCLLLGALTVPAGGGSRGRFGRRPPFALSHRALFQLKRNRREREREKKVRQKREKMRRAYHCQNFTHISSKYIHQHILAKLDALLCKYLQHCLFCSACIVVTK